MIRVADSMAWRQGSSCSRCQARLGEQGWWRWPSEKGDACEAAAVLTETSLGGGLVLGFEAVEGLLYQPGGEGVGGDPAGTGDIEANGFAVEIHERAPA